MALIKTMYDMVEPIQLLRANQPFVSDIQANRSPV